jgi:hypothetical protein
LKARSLNFKLKEIITLVNLKPICSNKFQRHEKIIINLEKEKFLIILKIEESIMSMEENNRL